MFALEARGYSGGIWCLWDSNRIEVEVLTCNVQAINLAVLKNQQLWWALTVVYASPVAAIRDELWQYIEHLANTISIPWLLLWDFKQVLSSEEKRGGSKRIKHHASCFAQVIDRCSW